MPIPDFQSAMRPLLEFISDGKEHAGREISDHLAERFNLSEQERRRLLPSGRKEVFVQRAAWAKAYLRTAGLIEGTGRGVYRITPAGLELLKQVPGRIDVHVLQTQPGFVAARRGRKLLRTDGLAEANDGRTPEEEMEDLSQILRESLGRDLLQRLKSASPSFFERTVVELLVRMGYGGTAQPDPSHRHA